MGSRSSHIQKEPICNIGELRQAIADLPDDMPVFDPMDEPLCITIFKDENEQYSESVVN